MTGITRRQVPSIMLGDYYNALAVYCYAERLLAADHPLALIALEISQAVLNLGQTLITPSSDIGFIMT